MSTSFKQILMSVIGIAILVVAIIGISFAFFNYNQVASNNITNSSVTISYREIGSGVSVINFTPSTDDKGLMLTENRYEFTVIGNTDSNCGLYYVVTVVPQVVSDKIMLDNKEISYALYEKGSVVPTKADGSLATIMTKDGLLIGKKVNNKVIGEELISYFINGNFDNISLNRSGSRTYVLQLWVNDTVKITNDKITTATNTYTLDDYNNNKLAYSLKLLVSGYTELKKR